MSDGASTRLALEEQLCFALHDASRAMTAAYRDGLAACGLTYPQYAVLLVLWEHDRLSLGEVGLRLQLDSATLSPLVKRLATRGLVERRRRVEDERVVDVSCTPAGRALRERVGVVQAGVETATGLPAPELRALRDDLHRLAARLRSTSSQPV